MVEALVQMTKREVVLGEALATCRNPHNSIFIELDEHMASDFLPKPFLFKRDQRFSAPSLVFMSRAALSCS
jgi:hypothetical protein